MAESVYKVIELVGTSSSSFEKAASAAVNLASKSLRDLRIAEITQLDMQIGDSGKVVAYRAKVKVSFKYESPASSSSRKPAAEAPEAAPAKKAGGRKKRGR